MQALYDAYRARKFGVLDAIRMTAKDMNRKPWDVATALGMSDYFIKQSMVG
jgi:hypothetical protein